MTVILLSVSYSDFTLLSVSYCYLCHIICVLLFVLHDLTIFGWPLLSYGHLCTSPMCVLQQEKHAKEQSFDDDNVVDYQEDGEESSRSRSRDRDDNDNDINDTNDDNNKGVSIIVKSLDFSTTDNSLRSFFSKYGDVVSASVLLEPSTSYSRGFGFV